jgi:agarase
MLILSVWMTPDLRVAHAGVVVDRDDAGRYWFRRAEESERFLSIGVNAVSHTQHQPRPNTVYYDPVTRQFGGDVAAWAHSAAAILIGANFNTVASWGSPQVIDPVLLHTPNLYVAGFETDRCLAGLRPDFELLVERRAREVMAPYAARTDVLGVFLDNEMPWWGRTAWDIVPTYTLLERAFELESNDPARAAALDFLKERHGTPEALSAAYGAPLASWETIDVAYLRMCAAPAAMADRNAFTELASERFFDRSTTVVRRLFPEWLILGTRFAGDAPESVIRATGKYCDVIAVNSYSSTPESSSNLLSRYWLLGGKPIIVTEFSWRATENQSGNPNTRGAGTVVATQQDRADKYREFIAHLAAEPMVIGYHWFQWADQSPQGRFDGEDSNFGIVDIEHGTYDTLLFTMRQVNAEAAALHGASTRPFPTRMPERHGVTYTPGQHPDRPPTMSLFEVGVAPHEVWHSADAEIRIRYESGVLTATYRTGREYGVGVSFRGPPSQSLNVGPSFAADLDGYEFIVLDAEIPAGLEVHLLINEAGADAPWKTFDMSAGDDAEAYSSLPMIGTGTRSQYRVRIADFTGQSAWGNQSGKRRIDMNAVGSVAFQLMAADLGGTARIFDLYLER